ncbi:hypothetical protein ElyMa_005547300 [Elysia marginata]|uniref:Uncharacterized protein n=1 Tax=Elysia marginata TaxID=1093978 RepID=A0AAV4EYJ6_9GAST|nr:hypothetical protein ElyMa_005547300 [Elysia marginata]
MSTRCTFVFALRRNRLNKLPSLLVWGKMPSSYPRKARRRSREKKMPNSVSARTHPCFTPLLIWKGSEDQPSYWTVPTMPSRNEMIILRSLGGHPILGRSVKSPFRPARSNALVKSMNARYSGRLCSRHFS